MNRKKIALYALLLSLSVGSLTGCKDNKENVVKEPFATSEPSKDDIDCEFYRGEDVIYDEIIKNASYNEENNEIDFYPTVDAKRGIVAICASNEVGIAYDEDLDRVWDSLYLIGLSKDKFCKRVFDSGYDKISITAFFSAKKQKDGNYQISYIALNEGRSFCYSADEDGNEYYLPSDLTDEYKEGPYVYGFGTVSKERAQELFEEQINWWFINMDMDMNHNKTQQEKNSLSQVKQKKITF